MSDTYGECVVGGICGRKVGPGPSILKNMLEYIVVIL